MANVPYKVNARDITQLSPLKPGSGGLAFGLDDCWHSVDTLGNVRQLAFNDDVIGKHTIDTPGGVPSLNVDGDQFGIVQSRMVQSSQSVYAVPLVGETIVITENGQSVSVAFGGDQSGISKNCVESSIHAMLNRPNINTLNLTSANRNDLELPGYYKMHAIGGTVNLTGISIPGHSYTYEFYLAVRSGTVTVKHQSTESLVANRFICNTATDIVLAVNEWARVIRDPFQNRWRISKW